MLNMAIRWFFAVFLLLLLGCNNGNTVNEGTTMEKRYAEVEKTERAAKSVLIDIKGFTEAEKIARAIKRLEGASRWIIENGIMEILTNSSYIDKFDSVIGDEFATGISTPPTLKDEYKMAFFNLSDHATNYTINLLKRSQFNGSIYEYWMIFKSSNTSVLKHPKNGQFLITRSDNMKSRREIIKESGQFFHQYKEGDAVVISLDYENNMFIRYKLAAWEIPHCYENYMHITQQKIRPIGPVAPVGKGNYEFVP
jgi:hypothetical protein